MQSLGETVHLTLAAFFEMKLGWLLPLVVVLLGLSVVLALLTLSGPLAPFVYPLF